MINVAVITGGKSYDVIGFYHLFHSLAGINSYIQHLDDFASIPEGVRDSYDVVLFFFMMLQSPTDEGLPGYCGKPQSALARKSRRVQGKTYEDRGFILKIEPDCDEIDYLQPTDVTRITPPRGLIKM